MAWQWHLRPRCQPGARRLMGGIRVGQGGIVRAIRFAAVPAVALSAFLALDAQNALADSAGNPTSVVLDLRAASTIALPQARDLKPVRFKTEDGRGGWAVRLSPNGPIPTPAFAEGRIYVGG